MMEPAKIILSAEEQEALQDRSFFIKKRLITEKIYRQFAAVVEAANESQLFSGITFPPGTDFTTGKISKGENYKGLPYLLLDFPRNFSKESMLAIRSMIWWGHFISSAFLISGERKLFVQQSIFNQLTELSKKNIYICIHESPWHHHFGNDNYVLLKKLNRKEIQSILNQSGFIKLARKIPVSGIAKLNPFMMESFKIFAGLLK